MWSGTLGYFQSNWFVRHVVDGWQLDIYTDNKPLTLRLLSPSAKYLGHDICQLESPFDIRFLTGKGNTIADALSLLEVHFIANVLTLNFEAVVASQENEIKIHNKHSTCTALQLQHTLMFYCSRSLWCGSPRKTPWPFVPEDFRRQVLTLLLQAYEPRQNG